MFDFPLNQWIYCLVHHWQQDSSTAMWRLECVGSSRGGVWPGHRHCSSHRRLLPCIFPTLWCPHACFFFHFFMFLRKCLFTSFKFKANIERSLKYPKHCSSFSAKEKPSPRNVEQLFELGFILLVCLCQVLGVGFRVHSSRMSICRSGHK